MLRSAVFLFFLVHTAVVTPIPTSYASDEQPVIIVDFDSGGTELSRGDEIYGAEDLFSSVELTAIPSSQVERTFRYTIGKRIPHDRVVSQHTDTDRWASPQNVTLILQYPSGGQGAFVTYVEVTVNQSSNLGRAFILTGGIGKRFITAIVEANSTYWFNYSSTIYGI